MVEHDAAVTVLRDHIAWALDTIDGLMTSISEVQIHDGRRTFETPPPPWIDQRFFDLLEELGDPNLPTDRLLFHALGLEEALRKLRVAATLWLGRVVEHASGLNRRADDWAVTMTAMGISSTVTLAARRAGDEHSADPVVVRALVLDVPNGPPALSVPTWTKRAA